MDPRQVKTADDARKIVRERNLSHVKVGVFDIDGILRGKYLARDKFFSALDGGMGFCDVVLGWDSNDQLYDNATYTGWHTAYPDAPVRIVPDTCRDLPHENGMLFFMGEFAEKAEEVCPRAALRRVIDKARKMGFEPMSAVEYEFFVFEETPHSVRAKGYKNLKPITPGYFGYSVLRNSVHSEWYHALLQQCEAMDTPIEGLHTETGAGVLEAAIRVDTTLASADKAALFKTFTKVLAERRGWMASFMAKWSKDWPGCGGHVHMSLWKGGKGKAKKGESVFYDPRAQHRMSDTMRHFVAGQQALMPEFLALVAPTVNSFRRLIPGFWAPTSATWGVENRTTALRVIPGSSKSQRVEYRVAAADGNPYLSLAAALASGLWGIENKLELEEPVTGNSYEKKHPAHRDLPRTLMEAAHRFKASKAARAMFGDAFVDHYAASRDWEEREFRKHISDWELDRYFEII
jgi:glutamine synthetase